MTKTEAKTVVHKRTKEIAPDGFACDYSRPEGRGIRAARIRFCSLSADVCYDTKDDDHAYFCRLHDPFPESEAVNA